MGLENKKDMRVVLNVKKLRNKVVCHTFLVGLNDFTRTVVFYLKSVE